MSRIALALAFVAVLAPMAHVLEMPNKLALDGALWLEVQRHLYRGWGPVLGAPGEIGALLASLWLAVRWRGEGRKARLAGVAAVAYAGMLAAFFVFNSPVNAALNGWTVSTLPADWSAYRVRWEIGHALAAVLALVGLASLGRAFLLDREGARLGCVSR